MHLAGIILITVTVFGEKIKKSNKTHFWEPLANDKYTIKSDYEAKPKDFPYAARLYVHAKENQVEPSKGTCTTAIIHPKFVITAAQCAAQAGKMVVVVGDLDHNDYVNGVELDAYVEYNVTRKIVHPMYSPFSRKHDIALLKLEKSVTHKGFEILPVSYKPLKETMEAVIYGWGENSEKGNTLYGKKVLVKSCKNKYPDYENICPLGYGSGVEETGSPIIIDGKLQGICSHYIDVDVGKKRSTKYKYSFTALWEEKEFLELALSGTGLNNNECFLYLTMVSLTFII